MMRHTKGFTLTELLFSIAIMGVLSTIVLANFHRGQYSNDLQAAADKMVGNIRRMQNLAMAGAVVTPPWDPTLQIVPPGGFGIEFRDEGAPSYVTFADVLTFGNPCKTGVANEAYDYGHNLPLPPCNDVLVEGGNVKLENRITVSKVYYCNFNGHQPYNIMFKPPQPIPYLDGAIAPATFQITLTSSRTGQSRTVYIDATSGLVSERMGSYELCP